MKNLICLFVLVLLTFGSQAKASEYKCTEWTKVSGISCIFAGRSADVFRRQCENACWYNSRTRRGNMGPSCDQERVCHTESPATFTSECSKWTEQRGTTCHNPNTGDWEQSWKRACTVGIKESWCSYEDPNNL